MKHLVVGCGEVGKALMEVLQCPGYDPQAGYVHTDVGCDVLNVCIPYSENFIRFVHDYQRLCRPTFVVIHSTVPIGTSDSLQAHHSPIRGKHPHLASSIRTFRKYVGGPSAQILCEEFSRFGIEAIACPSARDTEAGKLLDLMQYGASVLLEKEIHEFCEKNGLDFDIAYRHFNETYNAGYAAMGDEQFIRPVLRHQEGPIGGHCVAQNMKWVDSDTARDIISVQEQLSVSQKINV